MTKKTTPAKNASAKPAKPAKVTRSFGKLPENRVTTKRLSRLSDADRKKALTAFEKGAKIADLAKTYGLKESNLRYSILSERVRNGSVAPISATDVKALRKVASEDGPAVAATRAGISGTKLREILS